jgi:hypothetical protein
MDDPFTLVALAASAMLAVGLACAAGLRGWTGWLELRRLELGGSGRVHDRTPGARPDLAELRARVRRLEAIANGAEG